MNKIDWKSKKNDLFKNTYQPPRKISDSKRKEYAEHIAWLDEECTYAPDYDDSNYENTCMHSFGELVGSEKRLIKNVIEEGSDDRLSGGAKIPRMFHYYTVDTNMNYTSEDSYSRGQEE
tara:strand:+ start:83 stop:439 length:357 start_codon:yes stop_codon:yes gene_type:complete